MQIPFLQPGAVVAASVFVSQLLTPLPAHGIQTQTYNTAADIPQVMFQNHETIYGRVVKVADGDTLRIRHYPLYPDQQETSYNGKLSDNTISIRLYGIDTPEIKKNGNSNPSMPFAEEAREYTVSKVGGKVVQIKLFQKDQYNRVLGKVTTTTTNPPPTDLSVGLLHNGYAFMYEGKGAEYDGKKEKFLDEIRFAQKNRMGMWYNGVDNVQSPAEYKRIMKAKAKEEARLASDN